MAIISKNSKNKLDRFRVKVTDRTSRYNRCYRYRDSDGNEFLETQDKINIPNSKEDLYMTVTEGEKDRLDLVSNRYYNTPLLWWVIALASDIFDPYDVPVGTVLRIPPMSTIYGVRGVQS